MLNPKDHPVGSRLLARDENAFHVLFECEVLNWAPSREFVKLKFCGGDSWRRAESLTVVEVLQRANARPQASAAHRDWPDA